MSEPKNFGEVLNIIEQNNPFQVMRVGQLAHDHWIRFFEVIKTMFRDLLKREKTSDGDRREMRELNKEWNVLHGGSKDVIPHPDLIELLTFIKIKTIEKLGEGLI